jgi:hypothetical protein
MKSKRTDQRTEADLNEVACGHGRFARDILAGMAPESSVESCPARVMETLLQLLHCKGKSVQTP